MRLGDLHQSHLNHGCHTSVYLDLNVVQVVKDRQYVTCAHFTLCNALSDEIEVSCDHLDR